MRRKHISASSLVILLLGAAYFLLPLVATFLFSMKNEQTGKCSSFGAYGTIWHDPQFAKTLWLSLKLALDPGVTATLAASTTSARMNVRRLKVPVQRIGGGSTDLEVRLLVRGGQAWHRLNFTLYSLGSKPAT